MRLAAFRDLTRFEQTLFGIPFVLSGLLLGSFNFFDWKILTCILTAFMLARISGMAFNQLIDRHIDARNPRTQNRAVPSGRVSVTQARTVAWGALGLFIILCLQMNRLTAVLSVLAAVLLYAYSYMKRVHASCHLVLACIHFLGPVMAFTAVTGTFAPYAAFLGAAAAFSILGTDIVYAMQDYEYDCTEGLFSIPSRLGLEKSLFIAALAHGLCLLMLACLGWSARLPLVYYMILPLIGAVLGYFHFIARQQWRACKNFVTIHEPPACRGQAYLIKAGVDSYPKEAINRQDRLPEQVLNFRAIEPYFFFCSVAVSVITLLFILVSRVWAVLL